MIAQISDTVTTLDVTRPDDLAAHIDDEIRVNAIRNGQLVEVYWNDLTDDERTAARYAMFYNPYC